MTGLTLRRTDFEMESAKRLRSPAKYKMPVRRSNKVLDNWQEPPLIMLTRVDAVDPQEVRRLYVAKQFRKQDDGAPDSIEAFSRDVEGYIEAAINTPGHIMSTHILELQRMTLQSQKSAHYVLTRLAASENQDVAYDDAAAYLNREMLRIGAIPYLKTKPREDVKLTFQWREETNPFSDESAKEEIKASEVEWLYDIFKQMLTYADRHLDPEAPTGYGICPICERIFAITRPDRAFCSDQCSGLFRVRKSKLKQNLRL